VCGCRWQTEDANTNVLGRLFSRDVAPPQQERAAAGAATSAAVPSANDLDDNETMDVDSNSSTKPNGTVS
jgi:hypothetical protein